MLAARSRSAAPHRGEAAPLPPITTGQPTGPGAREGARRGRGKGRRPRSRRRRERAATDRAGNARRPHRGPPHPEGGAGGAVLPPSYAIVTASRGRGGPAAARRRGEHEGGRTAPAREPAGGPTSSRSGRPRTRAQGEARARQQGHRLGDSPQRKPQSRSRRERRTSATGDGQRRQRRQRRPTKRKAGHPQTSR